MPAQADISVVFKEQNARGEWVEVCVQGSTLEDFRPVINRLGQRVKSAQSELFAQRRYLGAVLVQLRNRFAYGRWNAFVLALGLNRKTVWAAITLVERLCDERGEINEAKQQAAIKARPNVAVAHPMNLRMAEQLAGIRPIKSAEQKPVAMSTDADNRRAQMSTRADICTEQEAAAKRAMAQVSPFEASGDGFDVDAMDDADFDGQMVDASDQPDIDGDDDGDEWLIGEQMTFADLRAQADLRLRAAVEALNTMNETKRDALERVLRDIDALLT